MYKRSADHGNKGMVKGEVVLAELNEQVAIEPINLAQFVHDYGFKYAIIFVCIVYIYHRVFRTRRLSILQNAVLYILMLIGSFLLLLFEVDAELPIITSLLVAVVLIFIVRIRYFILKRKSGGK